MTLPPWPFLVFELSIYVLAILSLVHAWRRTNGRYFAFSIIAALIYGLVSENLQIRTTSEYYYNRFLVMMCLDTSNVGFSVGSYQCNSTDYCVPLVISTMESLIIYAVMFTSDRLGFAWGARPFLDALLAVSIDTWLDPVVAVGFSCITGTVEGNGLGFWVWELTAENPGEWFGIPLNNYGGWFLGIFFFSLYIRLGRWRYPPGSQGVLSDIIVPLLAIPLAMVSVALSIIVYVWLLNFMTQAQLLLLIFGVSLLVVLYFGRDSERGHQADWLILSIPLFLYEFCLFVPLIRGIYAGQAGLWLVAAGSMIIGFICFYLWPCTWIGGGAQHERA